MTTIGIRPCSHHDAAALSVIGKKTFYDTWHPVTDEENMKLYLDEAYSEESILRHLKHEHTVYYCAEVDSDIAGFTRVSHNTDTPEELKDLSCLALAQIYVDRKYHGKKVGAALMHRVIKHAEDLGAEVIWLSTWEDNERAVTFYRKFGFEKFGKHNFIMGSIVYEDILMKKHLKVKNLETRLR